MADRIGVMHRGVIREIREPEGLYNFPESSFCAQFLGDMNFLDGKISDGKLVTSYGEFKLNGKAYDSCAAGIRPERIKIVDSALAGSFEAVLEERTFSGDSCDWIFRAGEQRLAVRESAPAKRNIGETYRLYFEPDFLLSVNSAELD